MRQREIFRFWLPLFASWLLMLAEGPVVSAAVNRLPDAVVQLAAIGIVIGLAVAIESPIIQLLATSTALVRDRHAYLQVRRFTVHWLLALTAVAALLALTPLFDVVVTGALGAPPAIARAIRPALVVMIPWTAAIAWRRFLQGVLIAGDRTRAMARGTAVRLVASAGTAIALAAGSALPGALVGAWALIVGVVAEAAYVTAAARSVVRALPRRREGPTLTYRRLVRFHTPLAMTSVLTLMTQPLVTATLARLDRPVESLAAWPLIFQFMLLIRSPAFALPEAIIALSDRRSAAGPLAAFSRQLAWGSAATMALFAWTPLSRVYLSGVQGASDEVTGVATLGFALLVPLPPLAVLISWQRGRLIHGHRTGAVNAAMVARVVATVTALAVGVALGGRGILVAAGALVAANAVEWAYLAWRLRVGPRVNATAEDVGKSSPVGRPPGDRASRGPGA